MRTKPVFLLPRLLLGLLLLFSEPAPPVVHYGPAPHGHGILVTVTSEASEVSVLQRRGEDEWTLEDRIIQDWQAGDQILILEVERDSAGVVWQRRSGVDPPHFVIALPIVAVP